MIERTRQPGTASIIQTIKNLEYMEIISLFVDVVDICTDFLFSINLITNVETVNAEFIGWISVIPTVCGVVIFYVKLMLTKKFVGHQVARFKAQLRTMIRNNEDKEDRDEIARNIRLRM